MDFILSVMLPLALAIIMFALGLGLTITDFTRVVKEPKAFIVGGTLQIIALPLIAYLIGAIYGLSPELAFGLIILALCPGGPTSNIFTHLGRGDVALSVSLTAVVSLTSIITVPLLLSAFSGLLSDGNIPPVNVTVLTLQMVAIMAVPIMIGMIIRSNYGGADRLERIATKLATLLVAVIVVAALAVNWDLFVDNLGSLGPAVVTLLIIMMTMGTAVALLLRLDTRQTTTISIETGIQNGTLGIAIGSLIAGGAETLPSFALPSALYGILMYLVAAPYVAWRRSITD